MAFFCSLKRDEKIILIIMYISGQDCIYDRYKLSIKSVERNKDLLKIMVLLMKELDIEINDYNLNDNYIFVKLFASLKEPTLRYMNLSKNIGFMLIN